MTRQVRVSGCTTFSVISFASKVRLDCLVRLLISFPALEHDCEVIEILESISSRVKKQHSIGALSPGESGDWTVDHDCMKLM